MLSLKVKTSPNRQGQSWPKISDESQRSPTPEIEGVNETKLQEVNHLPDMLDCSTVSGYPHVIQFLLLKSLVCGKYILLGRCQSISYFGMFAYLQCINIYIYTCFLMHASILLAKKN
jgi:hypothetical protein